MSRPRRLLGNLSTPSAAVPAVAPFWAGRLPALAAAPAFPPLDSATLDRAATAREAAAFRQAHLGEPFANPEHRELTNSLQLGPGRLAVVEGLLTFAQAELIQTQPMRTLHTVGERERTFIAGRVEHRLVLRGLRGERAAMGPYLRRLGQDRPLEPMTVRLALDNGPHDVLLDQAFAVSLTSAEDSGIVSIDEVTFVGAAVHNQPRPPVMEVPNVRYSPG